MRVRRTILCLAAIFFWAAHDLDVASGQSSELMKANNSFKTLYQQGRYSEAEPYAKEALKLGTEEFGPNDPSTATLLSVRPAGVEDVVITSVELVGADHPNA
ncbi:MAG: tetratricopeptide repeat protein [candidate division NC10 bacterium]|jgi:hypothetical protein